MILREGLLTKTPTENDIRNHYCSHFSLTRLKKKKRKLRWKCLVKRLIRCTYVKVHDLITTGPLGFHAAAPFVTYNGITPKTLLYMTLGGLIRELFQFVQP